MYELENCKNKYNSFLNMITLNVIIVPLKAVVSRKEFENAVDSSSNDDKIQSADENKNIWIKSC